jgi:hypothetical protein
MESNLDDEYYKQYIQYKQQYLMLKQMKQMKDKNDLEGGVWYNPLTWFESSAPAAETPQQVADPTDGTYLVFYIDEDKINKFRNLYNDHSNDERILKNNDNKEYWNYFETVKHFVQESYSNKETKTNVSFFNKNEFLKEFKENAYILTKNVSKITSRIITDDINSDFDKDMETVKTAIVTIENIISNAALSELTCHAATISNIKTQINNFEPVKSEDYKNRIKNNIYDKIGSFFIKENGQEQAANTAFKTVLSDIKIEYEKILNEMTKSKYAPLYYDTAFPSFTRDNKNLVLEEINTSGVHLLDNTNVKMKPNMIIKLSDVSATEDDPNNLYYKYAEFIGEKSISNTDMYLKLRSLLTFRREIRDDPTTIKSLGHAA